MSTHFDMLLWRGQQGFDAPPGSLAPGSWRQLLGGPATAVHGLRCSPLRRPHPTPPRVTHAKPDFAAFMPMCVGAVQVHIVVLLLGWWCGQAALSASPFFLYACTPLTQPTGLVRWDPAEKNSNQLQRSPSP